MATLVLFNKPFDVLCQFTDIDGRQTLADFLTGSALRKVYPAGRLDQDSEGMLLLTDNGELQHQIAHPRHKQPKTYWVQVDGDIDNEALTKLREGVNLKDGVTQPAQATRIDEPELWPRSKPVRFRAHIPTSWISLTIKEGKNRQVRRMTAAVGFPTLRLIRYAVGDWTLDDKAERLQPGKYRVIEIADPPKKGTNQRRVKNHNTRRRNEWSLNKHERRGHKR